MKLFDPDDGSDSEFWLFVAKMALLMAMAAGSIVGVMMVMRLLV